MKTTVGSVNDRIRGKTTQYLHVELEEGDTEQLRRIIQRRLPAVMARFATKNRQYGENTFELGVAGQFPEIWRKVKLLREQLWEHRDTASSIDGTDEVIDDLMGHLLMLKDCLSMERRVKLDSGIQQATEQLAHTIREIKEGEETWIAPNDSGLQTYPPGFRGRHTYVVGDYDIMLGRTIAMAHGNLLRVANRGDERCGWKVGDPAKPSTDNRCVGIEGHGPHNKLTLVDGSPLPEDYHINMQLEAWPV